MAAAIINIGTMIVSMGLMVASGRLRRAAHDRAAALYDLAFRFGVSAALASSVFVYLKLVAMLNDQPVGILGLIGLCAVLGFKVWVALFARNARNAIRRHRACLAA